MQTFNGVVKEGIQFRVMHGLGRRTAWTFHFFDQVNMHVFNLAVVLNLAVFFQFLTDNELL